MNHRKQFFKGFKIIFPYWAKRASCITSGLLKKGWHSIQAQCVTSWRRRILNLKSIPPYSWTSGEITPLLIKWMTSQVYDNNDVLFPQIWKQTHQIKCSGQFTVNKRDTDCFEDLHEDNTKPSVKVSISYDRPQVFYGFAEGREGVTVF